MAHALLNPAPDPDPGEHSGHSPCGLEDGRSGPKGRVFAGVPVCKSVWTGTQTQAGWKTGTQVQEQCSLFEQGLGGEYYASLIA